jgi:hypothetical protein
MPEIARSYLDFFIQQNEEAECAGKDSKIYRSFSGRPFAGLWGRETPEQRWKRSDTKAF